MRALCAAGQLGGPWRAAGAAGKLWSSYRVGAAVGRPWWSRGLTAFWTSEGESHPVPLPWYCRRSHWRAKGAAGQLQGSCHPWQKSWGRPWRKRKLWRSWGSPQHRR